MENPDLLSNDLQVSPVTLSYLLESAKWGKFLAIMGFIFSGFMFLLAFFLPAVMLQLPPYNKLAANNSSGLQAGMTVVYLLIAVILFFPCFYLYKFSVKMQVAEKSLSQENFDDSLKNLKSLLKFCGIITIILLSFYVLIFVIALLTTALKR